MTDIAIAAGVSQATVSLVLSDAPSARVAQRTRARIRAIAAELGYTRRGGMPRASGAPVVGLLIDEVTTTPFAPPFLEAARDEAAAQGWIVATFVTGRNAADEAAALDFLAGHDLAGVLYTTLMTREVTPPERLSTLPVVLLNCHERKRHLPSVLPADTAGSCAATELLLRSGHSRIAHIPGETWGEAARDRQRGYRQALAAHGLNFDPALVGAPAWTVSSGRAAMAALLDLAAPPTAVTCYNDRVAMGACEAIRTRGLAIPADISIIGFDNDDLVTHLTPPLSTVQLPHEEMARSAIAMLATARGQPLPPRRVRIDCPLVLRQSVAVPAV